MPDKGGLQLLPQTRKKIEIHIPGQNKPWVLSLIFVGLILCLYLGLLMYKKSVINSINTVDSQLTELEKSRDKGLEAKLFSLSKQFAVVGSLLSSRTNWSDALVRIQSLVQPQIMFKTINTDITSRKFVFSAVAANYTIVAKQIAAFYTEDFVTDITLNKVSSLPTGGVDFTMQLILDPSKFSVKSN